MTKTIKRHITHRRKSPHRMSDLDKIKKFLRETSQDFRDNAADKFNHSIETVKDTSEQVQDYLSDRPVKTAGVSLVTGIVAGLCLGYYINNRDN